ncbi:MAG TPA: patatin-like phospholipase family protein [Gammaproteobacteria bacterium]|nr:patatin-like phospholipase family protein [Gammaproteobacteria bacterium]
MTSEGATTAAPPRQRRAVRLGWILGIALAVFAVFAYATVGYLAAPLRVGPMAPVPAALADQITVLGLPNARFWGWYDTQKDSVAHEWEQSNERERAVAGAADAALPPANYLAISGGGGDGAFGAGLLCGWYDEGTFPKFKLVTGVSTGSMIAPFAFLGGPYIEQLRKIYTSISDKDVHTIRALNGLYGVVFADALSDTKPLYELISRYVTEQMLADIAAEYAKGRLLLVATASLDQQRPVLWNIGAIAASGHPDALELVRKTILASAAIPGAFPPVMIDVDVNGQHFQEMNVDAGVVAQAFLYPAYLGSTFEFGSAKLARERHAYIIRNGRLDPNWASVNRNFLTITQRSIDTMIHYMGYNDLLRLYQTAQRDHMDYNLAYIESEFSMTRVEPFDPDYMRALFAYSYGKSRHGYEWHKTPPVMQGQLEALDR